MVASRENPGRCGSRRAGAAAALQQGFVLRCGRAGWDGGCGLPVTPAHFGMRTRQLAWRWGLDLRVAFCCFEHAGQYSGPGARRPGPPGSPPLSHRSSIGGTAVSRPQVIDDEEHERVHERVAAVDVAKDSGVVCTRTPHPSRPGARRSTVWTVKARMGAIRELGRQLKTGRHRDRDAGEHLGLLADLVLRAGGVRAGGAAGQRGPGQEPARPAQNGQTGRAVAGPADRDGAAAGLVRAAEGDPGPAGLHPGPHPAGPGADPVLAAAGKAAGRRAGQGVVRGRPS